jgi:hypothetical protein
VGGARAGNHRIRSIDMATKAVTTFRVHEKAA